VVNSREGIEGERPGWAGGVQNRFVRIQSNTRMKLNDFHTKPDGLLIVQMYKPAPPFP